MRRVHRTLLERLSYLAIYSCKDCNTEDNLPRSHTLHLGKTARCPKCGTYRIVRLKEPDRIDPMHKGLLNRIERLAGGRLYHCRYCRIQFFDRRRLAAEIAADETAAQMPAPGLPEVVHLAAESLLEQPAGEESDTKDALEASAADADREEPGKLEHALPPAPEMAADADRGEVGKLEPALPAPEMAADADREELGKLEHALPAPEMAADADREELGKLEHALPAPEMAADADREELGKLEHALPAPEMAADADREELGKLEHALPAPEMAADADREEVGRLEHALPAPEMAAADVDREEPGKPKHALPAPESESRLPADQAMRTPAHRRKRLAPSRRRRTTGRMRD